MLDIGIIRLDKTAIQGIQLVEIPTVRDFRTVVAKVD